MNSLSYLLKRDWMPVVIATVIFLLLISIAGGCSHKRAHWYEPKIAEPKPSATPVKPLLSRPSSGSCQDCEINYPGNAPLIFETSHFEESSNLITAVSIQLCSFEEEIEVELISPGNPVRKKLNEVEDLDTSSEQTDELDLEALEPVSTHSPAITTQPTHTTKLVPLSSAPLTEFTQPNPHKPIESQESTKVRLGPPIEEIKTEIIPLRAFPEVKPFRREQLNIAETYYAMAVEADKDLDISAMNMYFDAISAAWKYLQTVPQQNSTTINTARAWEIYHSATSRLLTIAHKTKHIDKEKGVLIPAAGGYRVLPIEYIGFPWTANDFDEFHPVGSYNSKFLKTKNIRRGFGTPLVVVRHQKPDDRWLPKMLPFAATAIIRPSEDLEQFDASNQVSTDFGHIEQVVGALQLYDPKQYNDVEFRCNEVALAADLTAPYAYALQMTDPKKKGTLHHHQAPQNNSGLFMLEPHQPGKIPVVFVHGLLSAPYTWAAMANEIEAHPDLATRYEIWGFQYPSERPFLSSAALLREQLHQATYESDHTGQDRPLRNMVLVGHSMGGLIAKLQVVDSQRLLWQHAAFHPFESLIAPADIQHELYRSFFFEKSQFANRVIFIGTPHQGSSWAHSLVGQTTSRLIDSTSEQRKKMHHQLLADNPALFRKEIRERIPTSIDLLDNESLILQGIYKLEPPANVKMHSIVGNGFWSIHDGATDGIVPVKSARLPGVQSEVLVTSMHHKLNKQDAVIAEVLRILREHARAIPSWRTSG